MRVDIRCIGQGLPFALLLSALPTCGSAAGAGASLDGGALYREHCAACHDGQGAGSRAPVTAVLATLKPDEIRNVLTIGSMAPMTKGLSPAALDAIVLYLTGKPSLARSGTAIAPSSAPACSGVTPPVMTGPRWNGWSPTLDNARFQAAPGLRAKDIPRLKAKWAFAFKGGVGSQPTVVGGRVYFGTAAGDLYSLDARTGCVHWRARVEGGVRAAVTVGSLAGPSGGLGRLAVFVGDRKAGVHALDAATGRVLWSAKPETHPMAVITGSPVLYRGRLYVPFSSTESASTLMKDHRCCTFRGSVAALDAGNGRLLWQGFTIDQVPRPYRLNREGGELWGPAGAAVWSAPTIDAKRGVLYVGSGNAYSDAPTTGSNAVTAMDLVTGEIRWRRQLTVGDSFMVGCTGAPSQPAACPRTVGPDHDVTSTLLRTLPNGRGVLLAGSKSGVVAALDPDHQGAMLWATRVSPGSALGGNEWGMAAAQNLLFVPVAEPYTPKDLARRGLHAISIADGRIIWSSLAPDPDCAMAPKGSFIGICTNGLSSAPTAIEGLVIEGSMDGILRAYNSRDGSVAWSFDLGQANFYPLNAHGPVKGDTMNAGGATVAGGMLFQVSGYQPNNPEASNLLLAFTVEGK